MKLHSPFVHSDSALDDINCTMIVRALESDSALRIGVPNGVQIWRADQAAGDNEGPHVGADTGDDAC